MAHKVIVPQKKNYVPQFLKLRDINSYSSIQNYQGLVLAGHSYWFGRFVPQLGSSHEQLCGDSMHLAFMVQCQHTYS